jgi:uncharacterized delta-60 repeat protein
MLAATLGLLVMQIPATATVTEGSLDPGFGSAGITATDVGAGTDRAFAVAIQKDGKIVVAGLAHVGAKNEIGLVRYVPGGTLDPSFSGDGKVTTPIGSDSLANAVAIQPDGKIVVAGYAITAATPDFAVARYNSNGTLDSSFSGDGIVTTPINDATDIATGVAIQSNGFIVVVGNTDHSGNRMAVVRYTPSGSLDPGFGTGGSSSGGMTAVRLNTNGTPDTTFSGDGAVATAPEASGSAANAIAIQPNGHIVIAGWASNGTRHDFAVVRYDTAGAPDATFAGPGFAITPMSTSNNEAKGVNIQRDGKIVVSGFASDGTHDSFAIVRYLAGGALDNNFSGDGKATTQVVSGVDNIATGQAMARNGKPVIVGYAQNGATQDFGVARFIGDANAPSPGVVVGLTRYTATLSFSFGWTASDDNTGIGRFDLIRKFAGYKNSTFSSYGLVFSGPPSAAPPLSLKPGYTYCFEVRAVDYAGNVGAYGAPSCTALPVDDRTMTVHGSWVNSTSTRDYAGTDRQSTVSGSSLTLPVAYRHLAVVVIVCSNCGVLRVYLGSTLIKTVNLFSSVTHYRRVIEVDASSTVKSGTLTLKQSSPGKRVIIDGVGVSLN